MKIKLLSILLSVFVFAACSTQEGVGNIEKNSVGERVDFKSFVDRTSRGQITNNNLGDATAVGLKDFGFGVLGYYSELDPWNPAILKLIPNFMYNQKISWSDIVANSWGYAPSKYWSNIVDSYYSFFAYAPYSGVSTNSYLTVSANDHQGTPYLVYSLPNDPLNSYDLVCSQVINRKTLEEGNSVVNFYFNHQLTRLTFDAKTNIVHDPNKQNEKTYVVIKELNILSNRETLPEEQRSDSFYNSGRFTFGEVTSTASSTELEANGYWDELQEAIEDYSLAKLLNAPSDGKIGDPSLGYDKSVGIVVQSTADAVSLFKNNEYLFLLPPNGDQGLNESFSFNFQIVYDIVTEDSALLGGYTASYDNKAIISLPNNTLKQGKAYKFVLTIGLDEVAISGEVVDWDQETNNDVDV